LSVYAFQDRGIDGWNRGIGNCFAVETPNQHTLRTVIAEIRSHKLASFVRFFKFGEFNRDLTSAEVPRCREPLGIH